MTNRRQRKMDSDENIKAAYWALHNATRYLSRLALLTSDEANKYHRDHGFIVADMLASIQRWERQAKEMWLDYHDEYELYEYPKEKR